MAGGDGATFYFDTNISGVAREIEKGLKAVQQAVNKDAKVDGGKVTGNLNNLPRDIALIAERAKVEIGKLNAAFQLDPSKALASGATLQSEYRRIIRDVESQIGRVTKGRQITAEVGLRFNDKAISILQDNLSRELRGALNLADMTGGKKGAAQRARVGPSTLPESTGTAFNLAQRNISDADAQAIARALSDAAKRQVDAANTSAAARERQAVNDTAAADASAQRAKAEKKSAADAQQAADAPLPPPKTRTRGQGKQAPQTATGGAGGEEPPKPTGRTYGGFEDDGRRNRNFATTSPELAERNRQALTGGAQDGTFASKAISRIGGPNARFVADTTNDVTRIYLQVEEGFVEVLRDSTLFHQKMGALAAQIRAQSNQITRQQQGVLRAQEAAIQQDAKTSQRAAAQQLLREYVDDNGQRRPGVDRVRGAAGTVFTRQQPGQAREFARTEPGRGERGVTPVPQNDPDYARFDEIYRENQERRQRAEANRQRVDERRTQSDQRRADSERARAQRAQQDKLDASQQARNAARFKNPDDSLQGDVSRIGRTDFVATTRDGFLRIFRETDEGLKEIDSGAKAFRQNAAKFRQQRIDEAKGEIRSRLDAARQRQGERFFNRLVDPSTGDVRQGNTRIGSTNKVVNENTGDIYKVDLEGGVAQRLNRGHDEFRRAKGQWAKQQEDDLRGEEKRLSADRKIRIAALKKARDQRFYQRLFDDEGQLRQGVERVNNSDKLVDKRGGKGNYQYYQQQENQRARRIDIDTPTGGRIDRQVRGSEGIFNNFLKGFSGHNYDADAKGAFKLQNALEGVAQAAGQTAKYSILGTALYGLIGIFGQAAQEVIAYQDSYTGLQVALEGAGEGLKVTGSTLNSLGDSAAQAGANIGQSLDLAAGAVRAFASETDRSQESLDRLQTNFASTASKLAVISSTDIKTAADNLQAIGLAFDIPDQSFDRVLDVIAGAKSIGGGNEDDIATGLANIGVQFKELGFTAEETGAIISKVQAETAQSGTLIASRLTRATSILGGNEGTSALRTLNAGLAPEQQIDTTADTKTKIQQLSSVYKDLSAAQKQSLINSLGGATASRELIITLENATDLIKKADEGFTGKGAEEFERLLNNIKGTLTQIQGNLTGIVTEFANTGVLDPLFILAKDALLPALQLVRKLLQTFNEIPRPVRTILFAVLEVSAAALAIKKIADLGLFTGALKQLKEMLAIERIMAALRGPAFIGPQEAVPFGPAAPTRGQKIQQRLNQPIVLPSREQVKTNFGSRAAAAESLRSGGTRGFSAAAGAAKTSLGAVTGGLKGLYNILGPIGTAFLGIGAAITVFQKAVSINQGNQGLRDLNAKKFEGITQVDFRDQAENLRSAAEKQREGASGFVGRAGRIAAQGYQGIAGGDFDFSDQTQEEISNTRNLADAYEQMADNIQKAIDNAKAAGDAAGALDFSSGDALANSIDGLSKSGYTAVQIVDGLNKKFVEMADAIKKGDLALSASEIQQVGSIASASGGTYIGNNQKLLKEYRENAVGGQSAVSKFFNPRTSGGDRVDIANQPDDYSNVDQKKLGEALSKNTTDFLTNGIKLTDGSTSKDLKNTEVRKALAAQYQADFKAAGLTDKDAKYAAAQALGDVQKQAEGLGNTAVKEIMVEYFNNLTSQLSAVGTETYLNYRKSGGSKSRGIGFQSRTSVETKGKIDDLQLAISTTDGLIADAESKGDTKGAADLRQKSAQARLQLDQLYIDYSNSQIADMQKAFELDQAGKASEDKMARLKDQADELAAEYQKALDAKDEDAQQDIQIKQAQNTQDQIDQRYADEAARRRNGVDTRDITGNTALDAQDAQAELDRLDEKGVDPQSEEYQKAERAKKEADQSVAERAVEAQNKLRKAKTRGDDSLQQAKDTLADDKNILTTMLVGSPEYVEQQNKIMNDRIELAKSQTETDISARNAGKRQDNSLRVAQQNVADAKDRAANFAKGTKEYNDAMADVLASEVDLAKQQVAFAILERNLNVLASSPLDAAQRNLRDAEDTLKTLEKGSPEYAAQLAAVNAAKVAVSNADVDALSVQRQLGLDLTNPVQVANEAVKTANERLAAVKAEAAKSNATPEAKAEAIGKAQLDVRSAQNNAQAAEFSQFLTAAQNADSLGRISHRAFLNILKGRRERLKAELATMDKDSSGYKQRQEQIQQLDEAIKAGADSLSGQFNIGDIKIPTPYEVRRAIKAKDTGTVLANNSAQGTAGNVVNDNSSKSVVLNGIPIQQVMTMIEELFGVKTRSAANRKVV